MFKALGLVEMSELQDVSKILVKALVLMAQQKQIEKVRCIHDRAISQANASYANKDLGNQAGMKKTFDPEYKLLRDCIHRVCSETCLMLQHCFEVESTRPTSYGQEQITK